MMPGNDLCGNRGPLHDKCVAACEFKKKHEHIDGDDERGDDRQSRWTSRSVAEWYQSSHLSLHSRQGMFVKHNDSFCRRTKAAEFYSSLEIPGRYAALISHSFGAKRFDHGPYFAVLENQALLIISFLNGNVDHRSRQIVSANHLVGKYQPKHWVDGAQ